MKLNPVNWYFSGFGATRRALTSAVAIAVIAGSGLTGCEKKAEVAVEPVSDVQTVEVTKVVSKKLDRVDQLPGEIYAYQDVAIYPKVPGFIKWIGVDRGSTVKKGQLLVGLIAPELIAQTNEASSKSESVNGQLHEAEARLASAKASFLDAKAKMLGDNDTYTRTKDASKIPGVVAPNEVIVLQEQVSADRERMSAWQENIAAAQKQITSLEHSLAASKQATANYKDIADYLTIAAPFDGYITERNMHVGSFVGPLGKGAYPPIVRIQQLNPLRITTPVPEVDVSGVVPGAQVEFSVSTHPGERFVGTVARVGNYLDQKTRTMPVELNYWQKKWNILPGMFCEVYWPTHRERPSLMVPSTSVVTTSTLETFVCRMNAQKTIEWIPVKRGLMMKNMIEVFGSLHEGDTVALKGTDELSAGTHIEPQLVTQAVVDAPAEPRPSYHVFGTSLNMPESERLELAKPENRGKEWVH
jgi:RND family efflux transporter MFP subunit